MESTGGKGVKTLRVGGHDYTPVDIRAARTDVMRLCGYYVKVKEFQVAALMHVIGDILAAVATEMETPDANT